MRPLDPVSCFEASEVQQSLRHLQEASHIGKVIVKLPCLGDQAIKVAAPPTKEVILDPNAAYLLVGGSTGLGASIATWLVEKGARKLVFLSRGSGTTEESRSLYKEIESLGCQCTAVAGSVTDVRDIQRAIEHYQMPIKGVFDLAMVLDVSVCLLILYYTCSFGLYGSC